MIKKLLDVASAEVGYLEKKSNAQLDDKTANAGTANYTKFWRDTDNWLKWNINGNSSQGNPWCACFVSWCFIQAGIGNLIAPFYYCPAGVNNFRKAGQGIMLKPQAGDVIFFKDSSGVACHVGIVEKVDGVKVYTIEGNTSSVAGVVSNGGCVARKSYSLSYGSILGYGRPKYESLEEKDEMSKIIDELVGEFGEPAVKSAIRDLIVARQCEEWKVAGSDWLHAEAALSSVHNQNEPVTFGVLGTILSKLE
jgi:hypothetical protein